MRVVTGTLSGAKSEAILALLLRTTIDGEADQETLSGSRDQAVL
jgi:hypothetical protein